MVVNMRKDRFAMDGPKPIKISSNEFLLNPKVSIRKNPKYMKMLREAKHKTYLGKQAKKEEDQQRDFIN